MTTPLTPKTDAGNLHEDTQPLLPETLLKPRPPPERSSELYGYKNMGLSCLGFSGMSFFLRIAEDKLHSPPMSSFFIRSIIHTSLALFYITRFLDLRQTAASLSATQWKLLALLATTGALALAFLFKGVSMIPVGNAVTIYFLNAVLSAILSNILLSEPITPIEALAALTSFVGVVLISKPRFGLSINDEDPTNRLFGALWTVVAAVFAAFSNVTARFLGTSIHFMLSVFSLTLGCLLLSVAFGGFTTPAEMSLRKEANLFVVLSSLSAFAGEIHMYRGLQHCRVGPGLLIRNLDVPIVYILGILFLRETPSLLQLVGSAMVVIAGAMIGVQQMVRS